jgi:hypothetical protein
VRLVPKSPEMLAALGALATSWREDAEVMLVLDQALKSRDPEVRNAATPRRRPSDRSHSLS